MNLSAFYHSCCLLSRGIVSRHFTQALLMCTSHSGSGLQQHPQFRLDQVDTGGVQSGYPGHRYLLGAFMQLPNAGNVESPYAMSSTWPAAFISVRSAGQTYAPAPISMTNSWWTDTPHTVPQAAPAHNDSLCCHDVNQLELHHPVSCFTASLHGNVMLSSLHSVSGWR